MPLSCISIWYPSKKKQWKQSGSMFKLQIIHSIDVDVVSINDLMHWWWWRWMAKMIIINIKLLLLYCIYLIIASRMRSYSCCLGRANEPHHSCTWSALPSFTTYLPTLFSIVLMACIICLFLFSFCLAHTSQSSLPPPPPPPPDDNSPSSNSNSASAYHTIT